MSIHSLKRKLNEKEERLASANSQKFERTMKLAVKAMLEEEARYNDAGEDRGNSNAFLHAYWSALLAKNISIEWSKKWTDAHEEDDDQNEVDRAMDLFNNKLGQNLFMNGQSDEVLAVVVENAISAGKGKIVVNGKLQATSNFGLCEKNIFTAIYKKLLSIIIELLVTDQINSLNADGMTPLMVACITDYKEAVKELIACSDLQYKDSQKKTVLMFSVQSSYDIFKMILDSSSILNEQDNQGQTALMYAASQGDLKKVEALIMKGADPNLKMKNKMTAYDLAQIENHNEVAILLKCKQHT